ncbi:hypothetical protein J6590_048527, partial [Homalodisca vitripennis]
MNLYSSSTPGPVFISEHLTQHNKVLLQCCKTGVRAKALTFIWFKNGKVFVRMTQDSGSAAASRSWKNSTSSHRSIRPRTTTESENLSHS